jgi:formate-dependent nitrite reductase membrane component NrfD
MVVRHEQQRIVAYLAIILLLILPAGIGTVLDVMSKNRKEVKAWWPIGVIGLNMLMLFTGIFLLFAG